MLLHKGFIITSETALIFTFKKYKLLEIFYRYTNCLPQCILAFFIYLMKRGEDVTSYVMKFYLNNFYLDYFLFLFCPLICNPQIIGLLRKLSDELSRS